MADDFPAAPREAWLALVEKTLKGQSFEEALVSRTVNGLPIQPLYTEGPANPRDLRPRDPARPWDLRTLVAHPDPARANADILKDLEQGAASVLVRIDPTGQDGVAVADAQGLARVLDGVLLDLAPVALDAGFLGPKAADWLAALAKAAPGAPLAFHMDPLSAFARAGASPGPMESHLVSAATVGARLLDVHPRASLMLASGTVVHEAGGGEAEELAVMSSAAVAYARALVRAGLTMEQAFGAITLGVSVDSEYFTGIAKLRAARVHWARITAACGVDIPARIEVRSSHRMLTRKDPWTNLIRLTAAGFAAATGGADAIVLGGYTDAIGLPTAFARRQARNTQLVLMEEAHLGRVADPAGGAAYLETLTDQIARAAWGGFQAIEAEGGLIEALSRGVVAQAVTATRDAWLSAPHRILGVNAFPNADETPAEVETPDAAAFALPVPDLRIPGPAASCPPLAPVRLAAALEEA
ncbi:MAG TPA: methylmalonyl-CoA mutase family protein [Caulobacter sp.]|nr:methylmalonyl-CoA mutase family protein [Caulobacter sp.]